MILYKYLEVDICDSAPYEHVPVEQYLKHVHFKSRLKYYCCIVFMGGGGGELSGYYRQLVTGQLLVVARQRTHTTGCDIGRRTR